MPRKESSPSHSLTGEILQVIQRFNEQKIRYMIAGARALAFHGYPRFTRDYDLCVTPDPAIIDHVLDILSGLGFQISEPVDASMIAQSINIHLYSEVDLDLLIHPKGFAFEEAWQRRITVQESGAEVYFVSKEDLIAMKEASGRLQDKADVENLKEAEIRK